MGSSHIVSGFDRFNLAILRSDSHARRLIGKTYPVLLSSLSGGLSEEPQFCSAAAEVPNPGTPLFGRFGEERRGPDHLVEVPPTDPRTGQNKSDEESVLQPREE